MLNFTSTAVNDPSFLAYSFLELPLYAKIYIITFGSLCAVGICGNAMTIFVLMFDKKFQESRNLFLISLSAADLLVSGSTMPASIGGLLLGKHRTESNRAVCTFTALLCAPSCIASLYSIVWIAVSRYYFVTKYSLYVKIFTRPLILFYVALIWLLALMVHLPNYYGWGQIHYSTVFRYCTLDTELFSYLLFYASFLLLAIILSFTYYTKIYLVLRKTTLARGIILGNQGKKEKDKNEKEGGNITMSSLQDETKMIRATFKIFVLFFVCWAPLTTLFFLRFLYPIPLWAYLYATMLAHGNSTLNFLVYFTSNENFVLALKKFCRNVVKYVTGSDNKVITIINKTTLGGNTKV